MRNIFKLVFLVVTSGCFGVSSSFMLHFANLADKVKNYHVLLCQQATRAATSVVTNKNFFSAFLVFNYTQEATRTKTVFHINRPTQEGVFISGGIKIDRANVELLLDLRTQLMPEGNDTDTYKNYCARPGVGSCDVQKYRLSDSEMVFLFELTHIRQERRRRQKSSLATNSYINAIVNIIPEGTVSSILKCNQNDKSLKETKRDVRFVFSADFHVDEATICRAIRRIAPLAERILKIKPEKLLSENDLQLLMVDATEQRIERPKNQWNYY